MSSSETSYSTSGRQEMLYKVFIHRGNPKNPPLKKQQIEEWFAELVEPFKVNVPQPGFGFAYFGSKRDARACISAFDKQPPYYYNIYVGQPEEVPMTERDMQRLSLELKYKAERLELIKIQMRELRLEKSKLTNDLEGLADYCSSGSEVEELEESEVLERHISSKQSSYFSDRDDELRLDKQRFRSKSRSRVSEYLGHRDKSENRSDRSENRRDRLSSNSNSERPSRNSMSNMKHNSNGNYNNKYNRHSIATTSSTGFQKTPSNNIQQRVNRVSSNKENIRSFSSKQHEIPVETVPTNRFVQATVQHINKKDEIWVTLTSNYEQLNKINILLNGLPKHSIIPAYDIHLNCYCIVEFDDNGTWYRAQVIYKPKSDINVLRLIDYGNQVTCIHTVVEMPDYLYEIPAQAIKISIPSLQFEHLNIQQKINIKAISKTNNNLTFCEISSNGDVIKSFENKLLNQSRNESSSQVNNRCNLKQQSTTPIKKSFDKRECIINSLRSSQKGTLKLKTINDSQSCVAQITVMGDDFSNYVQAIQNIWEKYPTEFIQPSVGDLVCVENDADEGWSRGYVVNKMNTNNEYCIALIDDGVYVNQVTKCCKLLPEHVRIPDFACLCNVIEVLCDQQKFTKFFTENKTYSFIINAVGVDSITNIPYVKCILKDRKTKEDICEMKLSSWILTVKLNSSHVIESNTNCIQTDVVNNQQSFNTNSRPAKIMNGKQSPNSNYTQTKANQQHQQSTISNLTNQQQSFIKYDGIIPKVTLLSESIVMIALVESQQTLYVKYRESNQHLKKVTELIESSVPELEPMDIKTAKIGKCVAAQFSEDGAWYRGEIISINNNTNIASVLYIDYGNKEEVNINETKMLSNTLLDIPRSVVEIKLHNLPNKPLTLAQAKYIDQCMESKTKYKMIVNALYRDVCLLNGNENFNEKLLSLSTENNKKSEEVFTNEVIKIIEKISPKEAIKENFTSLSEDNPSPTPPSQSISTKKIVTPSPTPISQSTSNQSVPTEQVEIVKEDKPLDILFVDLPLGKTKIIFQAVLEPLERVIACYPDDLENLIHITDVLSQEISDYVHSNTKETSYKPCQGGPCIAKFEESWYRALCLETDDETNEALVIFVDFGNHDKVKFTNIRKLPNEFAKYPAIAIICTVMDVPSDVSATAFTNSLSELQAYEVDVLEKEDEAQYKIHIPGVSAVN